MQGLGPSVLAVFFAAAFFEIAGGYYAWQWLREKKGPIYGWMSLPVSAAYGVLLAFEPANFGRVYAAYGGVFIVGSILWGWLIDRRIPDRWDLIGSSIALVGALIIMFAPR